MIKLAGTVFMLDLDVGDRRLTARAPVDDSLAAIYEPGVPPPYEAFHHGIDIAIVHCEPRAVPIKRAAEPLKLGEDDAAVLVNPLPGALDESLAAQVVPCKPFLLQLFL